MTATFKPTYNLWLHLVNNLQNRLYKQSVTTVGIHHVYICSVELQSKKWKTKLQEVTNT